MTAPLSDADIKHCLDLVAGLDNGTLTGPGAEHNAEKALYFLEMDGQRADELLRAAA